MSVTNPSIAQAGGTLSLVQEASAMFGAPVSNQYQTQAQPDNAVYVDLTNAASTVTVPQTDIGEPPNSAMASRAELTANIRADAASAAAAQQLASAATTLTLTAEAAARLSSSAKSV
jgi:hypothetical protein